MMKVVNHMVTLTGMDHPKTGPLACSTGNKCHVGRAKSELLKHVQMDHDSCAASVLELSDAGMYYSHVFLFQLLGNKRTHLPVAHCGCEDAHCAPKQVAEDHAQVYIAQIVGDGAERPQPPQPYQQAPQHHLRGHAISVPPHKKLLHITYSHHLHRASHKQGITSHSAK